MMAWAFTAAPKSRPPMGTPPMTSGSTVSVIRSEITRCRPDLEGGAAGDDLALVEGERRDRFEREPYLTREGRVVARPVRLHVMLRLRHHHAIDEDARDGDLARGEGAGLGNALDLAGNESAGVPGRHGQGQVFEREGLALHGHVAVGVGGGPPNEGDVNREGFVKERLFPVQGTDLDDVFPGRQHLAQRHASSLLNPSAREQDLGGIVYWFRRRFAKPRMPWGMKMTMAVKMMPTGMR